MERWALGEVVVRDGHSVHEEPREGRAKSRNQGTAGMGGRGQAPYTKKTHKEGGIHLQQTRLNATTAAAIYRLSSSVELHAIVLEQ